MELILRLKRKQVGNLDIRSRPKFWGYQTKWAKEFKVSTATICAVVNNKIWN